MLFEGIGSRYKCRSTLITAGGWGGDFPDQAITLAPVGRFVHHTTILEMNVASYRCDAARDRKRRKDDPAGATIKTTAK